jgi:hypothetical protein
MIVLAAASPASASVTLGQLSSTPSAFTCGNQLDFAQLSVASGNDYAVPGNGVITSWTTFGPGGPAQRTFKVFRKVADPARYQVVGHDGPRDLTPGGVAGNTFTTGLRVKAGDLIGFENVNVGSCYFDSPGSQFLSGTPPLQDGEQGDLSVMTGKLLELEAVFVPDNRFKLASTTRNRKKGTATLGFGLPNLGTLTGKGPGAKVTAVSTGPIGGLTSPGSTPSLLRVRAVGSKRRQLDGTGNVVLKLSVTYRPTGGDPTTERLKVKLRKG